MKKKNMQLKIIPIIIIGLIMLPIAFSVDNTLVDWSPLGRYNITTTVNTTYYSANVSYEYNGNNSYMNATNPWNATNQGYQVGSYCTWISVPAVVTNSSNGLTFFESLLSGQDSLIFGYRTTSADERYYMRSSALAWSATKGFSNVLNKKGLGFQSICYTWNATQNNSLVIYINGVNQTAPTFGLSPNGTVKTTGNDFFFGNTQSGSNYLNGSMGDTRMWNISLSVNQVLYGVYNNDSVACSNLVDWYPFKNSSNTCNSYCTYQGSGNWYMGGYEACVITTNTNVLTNQFIVNGTGTSTITNANITNVTSITAIGGATITVSGGGILG